MSSLTENSVSPEVLAKVSYTEFAGNAFENFIEVLEDKSVPWFLRSALLYSFLKASAHVDFSSPYALKIVAIVQSMTDMLITSAKPLISAEDGAKLVCQIDEFIQRHLQNLDNTIDSVRFQLATHLRNLKAALISHYEKYSVVVTETYTANKSVFDKKFEEYFEITKSFIEAAVQHFQTKVVQGQSVLTSSIDEVKATVESKVTSSLATTQGLLETAQPYVRQAVASSQPYIVQAVSISQPYVDKSTPYLEPIAAQAVQVKDALEKHEVIGPYVTVAMTETLKVMEQVKSYCLEDPQQQLQEAEIVHDAIGARD